MFAESYLYTSMLNNFNQHMHEQLQQQENKPSKKITLF